MPLRGRSAFQRVFREGTRRTAGGVTAVVAPGPPGPARVGIVAGRRVGGAVARNRAKRRLREALRRALPADGADYVVIATAAVNEAGFAELVEWVVRVTAGTGETR